MLATDQLFVVNNELIGHVCLNDMSAAFLYVCLVAILHE